MRCCERGLLTPLVLLCATAACVDAQDGGQQGPHPQCDIPDVDECASSPCDNGAACRDSHNDTTIPHREYRCVCRGGFANGTCAVGWLATVPQYVGLCNISAGNCDVELDECLSHPCEPGAACTDLSTDPIAPASNAYRCATNCAAGRFASMPGQDNINRCEICLAGQFSREGAAHCTRCPPGQYQGSPGMGSCIQCELGSVTNSLRNDGAITCLECRAGRYSADSSIACADCHPGSVTDMLANTGASTCLECRAGQYSADSSIACADCHPGSVTPSYIGCTDNNQQLAALVGYSCQQIAVGGACGQLTAQGLGDMCTCSCQPPQTDMLANTGASTCLECRAGQYSPASTIACADCHPGSVLDMLVSTGASACLECSAGQYSPASTMPCQRCQPGSFSAVGSSECTACGQPLCRFVPVCSPDIDCLGVFEPCVEIPGTRGRCDDIVFSYTRAQSGQGRTCPELGLPVEGATRTCQPGEGECPQNVDCVGAWSTCDASCEKEYTITIPQSGTGSACTDGAGVTLQTGVTGTCARASFCDDGLADTMDDVCSASGCAGQITLGSAVTYVMAVTDISTSQSNLLKNQLKTKLSNVLSGAFMTASASDITMIDPVVDLGVDDTDDADNLVIVEFSVMVTPDHATDAIREAARDAVADPTTIGRSEEYMQVAIGEVVSGSAGSTNFVSYAWVKTNVTCPTACGTAAQTTSDTYTCEEDNLLVPNSLCTRSLSTSPVTTTDCPPTADCPCEGEWSACTDICLDSTYTITNNNIILGNGAGCEAMDGAMQPCQPGDGSDVAYLCSDPQWVASQDQSTCNECHAGNQPNGDRSNCEPCQPGTASGDGIQCLMCNDTHVNHDQSSISNPQQTACIPCGAGKEANEYASQCVNCPVSKYAPCTASGCQDCVPPLIVTPRRDMCVPAYRCPAGQSCVEPCLTDYDCVPCDTGSVSTGGDECKKCLDDGAGWVANSEQTACVQCPPGKMPNADRSQCLSCPGDQISMLGSECQPCSATQIANQERTECVECGYGEVADNGVCGCAVDYYNSSNAMISCSETCNVREAKIPTTQCSRCPPCVRCPVGIGLSSIPLINPTFGLPKAYRGQSAAELLHDDSTVVSSRAPGDDGGKTALVVYKCLVPESCSGDHFSAGRNLIAKDNIGRVLGKPTDADDDDWKQQLVSLAAGAGIRIEAESDFSESTLGSSLDKLGSSQLAAILYAYYVDITQEEQTLGSVDLDAAYSDLVDAIEPPGIETLPHSFDGLQVVYTTFNHAVVIPDAAVKLVSENTSEAIDTTFSCATGHDHLSPLCALCEPDYAGGSTHACKYCNSATTGYRVVMFLFGLALAWMVVALVPSWVQTKCRARMQINLKQSFSDGNSLTLVGATNAKGASVFTYMKIIVSHFQVLLQFSIVMDIDWPKGFQNILDYLSVFKGDLLNYLNVRCAVRLDLYSSFALAMLIAPCAFTLGLLSNAVQDYRRARKNVFSILDQSHGSSISTQDAPLQSPVSSDDKTHAPGGSGLLNQMFMVLFCIYPYLATKICHVFKCVTLEPGSAPDETWQQYDFNVNCTDDLYMALQSWAVLMFGLYPAGVPALAMWVFAKNWARLHGLESAPIARQQPLLTSKGAPIIAKLPWWYGDRSTFYFLVRDYKPRWFFFEIIEFVRKFALTGLLIFAERGSASQIVFGITLAFGFGLLNAVIQPYTDARTNTFRILADCSLCVTLLIVLMLHFKDELAECEFLSEDKLQVILITVNFVLLFLAANQELFRRLFSLYHQSNLVGILYNPDNKLLGGTGQNATLYRGQYRASLNANEVPAAIKVRTFDPAIESVETALMLELSHPNILKLFKIQEDGPSSYVAMELGDCSLKAAISSVTVGGEYDPITVCREIVDGVRHLHISGFVHGNITPENVVMFEKTPKLCGFSCTRVVDSTIATEMSTMRGTQGYQPLEILARKYFVATEVQLPEAVDTFGLGCTMFFILSGGKEAFRPLVDKDSTPDDVELNILSGASGIEASSIAAEGQHLLPTMFCAGPSDRTSLDTVLEHPLFWTLDQKVQYLGESVGSVMPVRMHKSQHPFIAEVELLLDNNLGAYNEAEPENGGSWSRAFNSIYPLTGDWGKTQRPPESEEHNYHIFGAPPSKKQAAERERQVRAGKLAGDFEAKEIRSVGLLKFMRNIYAHRAQQVEAGRFQSELDVCTWLLEPFPFLLMGVYQADKQHKMSTMFEEKEEPAEEPATEPAQQQQQQFQEPTQPPPRHLEEPALPPPQQQPTQQYGVDLESSGTSINPLSIEPEGTVTAL